MNAFANITPKLIVDPPNFQISEDEVPARAGKSNPVGHQPFVEMHAKPDTGDLKPRRCARDANLKFDFLVEVETP